MFQPSHIIVALSLAGVLSSPLFAAAANATEAKKDIFTDKATVALTSGEIKKVDLDSGKLTIQHGPLVNLHMPAMTMSFKAKDPSVLQSLKVGDKVRFAAESTGGALVITTLEKQP